MTLPDLRKVLVAASLFLAASSIRAQEFSASAGLMTTPDLGQSSYSWQIDYRQHFADRFAASAGWINEGHVEGHHRDGLALEVWRIIPLEDRSITLDFGGGAYRYFDTQTLASGASSNVQGWAPIFSFSATFHKESHWFYTLKANFIAPADNISTASVTAGIGYDLWKEEDRAGQSANPAGGRTTGNEMTLFLGKSIVNTLFSESAVAAGLEYRRGISEHMDWTLSWINEGDPEIIRRNGVASQVWLVDSFLNDQLTLGLGAGVYYFIDRKGTPTPGQDTQKDFAGLVSPTVSWRLNDQWLVRFTWNRVVTDYSRDADVFLLGLGYRWGGSH